MKTKTADEISSRFKEFLALLQTQCPQARIQRFRSDNGTGEYNNSIFQQILSERGITYEPSTPYTQHQNGVSERTIRSINDMARSMLHDSKLPEIFWSEAVNTAVYLRNRSPTAGLSNENSLSGGISGRLFTPFECYSGNRPSLGHIRPFGCNIWVHVPDQKRTKYESKTKRFIMLRHVVNATSIWRAWDPAGQRQTIVTDCVFDE